MKIERSKNTSRNIIFGIVLKIYQIICPFILRTALIYILGMEYVGLNSLFSSVIQVLSLSELGVGTAMVFSMYKPIAEDDTETVCKLMRLYKIYYRIIGTVILIIGILITPIIPKLITSNSTIPVNIYYLYWLNLGYTVLSYWLFAYKNSILQAHQRTDIICKITLFTNTCMYALQLSLLLIFKNYYLYLIGLLLGQAFTNVITALIANKMYPQYKAIGKLEQVEVRKINQRVKDLFTAKLGGVVQNSADSIVISAFLGLTILGKYNNYYYIMNSVFSFVVILFNSCLAGVGNSIVTESSEKNFQDFRKITFLTIWVAGFCECCLLCLYQPFMNIWIGEDNMLSIPIVCCIVVYFYIATINQMLCLYKDASGIWHADRFRPLIVSLINLTLNLCFVQVIGLFGVILSTVISMLFIGMPWLIRNLFKTVFMRSCKKYVKEILTYSAVYQIICIILYVLCSLIPDTSIFTFILKILLCIFIPNIIYAAIFYKSDIFIDSLYLIDNSFDNIINKIPIINKIMKR